MLTSTFGGILPRLLNLPPLRNMWTASITRKPHCLCIFSYGVGFHDGRMHLGKQRMTVFARVTEHRDSPSIGTLQSMNLRYGCDARDADAPAKHRWRLGIALASGPLLEWPA